MKTPEEMTDQELSEESLSQVVEGLKRLVAERGETISIKPTHMPMTGEGLAVAKRIMAERGMTTWEELCDHMQKIQQSE